MTMKPRSLAALAFCTLLATGGAALAEPDARLTALASQHRQPLLDTLAQLVGIESGSRDIAGLDKIAGLIADRLKVLGGEVEVIEPGSPASPEVYRMGDTPEKIGKMVRATFKGTGTRKIMLIAHMDTVYLPGMLAKQPFRIEGNRAYGLAIADDKQGIAVILHAMAMLQQAQFKDYGQITVLINGDEEISSPGSRAMIAKLAAEHDAVLSHESSLVSEDKLSLATAGIGAVTLKVQGKASHAGAAPEQGINAFYEMAHQVLQMRNLFDPASSVKPNWPSAGVKMNWTTGQAGSNRNVIPAEASATADVRVTKASDYDQVEALIFERVKQQLIPDAKVSVLFERRRPPLEPNSASVALARHAQAIYADLGKTLAADDKLTGGGTDAAFAGQSGKAAVVERFGLPGFGAHSANAEYVLIDAIEPRLYLVARLVMDISLGKVAATR